MCIQHRAALAFAHGAMTPWCRWQRSAMLRDQFVAGVIEKITVRRVRSLAARRHLVAIGRTVAFQPVEVADAVGAEAPQGVVADHVLGFMLEVVKHGFGRVAEPCRLLMAGTATGVDHPATLGTGTATGESVGNQDIGTLGAGLQRRAGPGRAPPDNQYIAVLVPQQRAAVGDLQRCLDRRAETVIERRHTPSYRWLAKWLAAT
ncbi:hypothetical protein D3C87_1442780 [compost metagenome]